MKTCSTKPAPDHSPGLCGITWSRSEGLLLLAVSLLAVLTVLAVPLDDEVRGMFRNLAAWQVTGGALDDFAAFVRMFGKGDVLAFMILLAGLCGKRRLSKQMLIALALSGLLVWPLKVGVHRLRPDGSNRVSFPSGDTASVAAVAVPLMARCPVLIPAAGVAVVAVAGMRIFNDKHYLSDVLAGLALGLIAGYAGMRTSLWSRWRLRRRHFAAAVGVVAVYCVAIYLTKGKSSDFIRWLEVFGGAAGLLVLVSRGRVWLRRRAGAKLGLPARLAGFSPRFMVFLLLLVTAVYLFVSSRSTLWDRDEPRFSRATVEMVQSGNYLYPTFNGILRADKPILIYWLMSSTVRLLGQTEVAFRFFAVLGSLLACFFTWLVARRLTNARGAVAAMLILSSTPLLMVSGTAATTDGLLLALMSGAIAAFAFTLLDGYRLWHWLLLILCLALAQLLKGPVGLAIPLLAMGGAWLLLRREPGLKLPKGYGWLLLAAVLISTGIFLAWAIPANVATDGEFANLGMKRHVGLRMIAPIDSHGGKGYRYFLYMFYYFPASLLTFFPFTLLLPGALSALIGRRLGGRTGSALLLAWAGGGFVLMSLVATKLPHYVLPCWPALVIAVAAVVESHAAGNLTARDHFWLRAGQWLLMPVGLLGGLALAVAPWVLPLAEARLAFTGTGIFMMTMTLLALREHRREKYGRALIVLLAGMLLLQLHLGLFFLPKLEFFKVSQPLAEAIRLATPETVPVFTLGYPEPSLILYLDRGPVTELGTAEDVRDWCLKPDPGVLVMPRTVWEELKPQLVPSLPLKEITAAKGYNYSKGKWVDLVAVQRGARS